MEIFTRILVTVLPVFAIMAAGFVYGRFKQLPAKGLTDLLFWVLIPCLVLGSLGAQRIDPLELVRIGTAALIVMTGTGLVAFLLFMRRRERRALLLPCVFMNSANMAFPLALFAFGEPGLTRQIVFYVAVHILHVTVGVGIARGKGGVREVFRLPLVYVAAVAVALSLSGIRIPAEVAKPLNLVGKATIPLMLLLLGSRLGAARWRHLGLSLATAVVRIGGGFAFGLLAVWLLDLGGLARAAVLIGAVMPAAVFNFVLGERYRLHPELMASAVVLSTLISIGTTPLFLWYIGVG